MIRLLSVLYILVILWPSLALAEPQDKRRIALVIGNSAYEHVPSLINPGNDARLIASTLEKIGISTVTLDLDLDHAEMLAALSRFAREAATADWAIIYFAGHGIEKEGTNYLIPTDAKLTSSSHLSNESIELEHLLTAAAGAKALKLVILDACRENPFARQIEIHAMRSIGRGLARVEPSGILVAYAARAGQQAEDGTSGNSPFAAALAATLQEPGLEVGKIFRKVRDRVLLATNGRQEPFTYGSLPAEDYYFVTPTAGVSEQDKVPAPVPPRPKKQVALPPAEAKPAPAPTGYVVQLATFRLEADAAREFRRLQSRYPQLLGMLRHAIQRADLGASGVFYRLGIGPLGTKNKARRLCKSLVAAGEKDCTVRQHPLSASTNLTHGLQLQEPLNTKIQDRIKPEQLPL
jgi:Caspase domain/SPOR domain